MRVLQAQAGTYRPDTGTVMYTQAHTVNIQAQTCTNKQLQALYRHRHAVIGTYRPHIGTCRHLQALNRHMLEQTATFSPIQAPAGTCRNLLNRYRH